MSRTIAHTPWEIARHNGAVPTSISHDHREGECLVETIDDVKHRFGPSDPHYHRTVTKWLWSIPCQPEMAQPDRRKFYQNHPPREFIRNTFNKPARQHSRSKLRLATREYNTWGETDTEPEPYRPCHQARYMWDMY